MGALVFWMKKKNPKVWLDSKFSLVQYPTINVPKINNFLKFCYLIRVEHEKML
jgi:hypothetical protein